MGKFTNQTVHEPGWDNEIKHLFLHLLHGQDHCFQSELNLEYFISQFYLKIATRMLTQLQVTEHDTFPRQHTGFTSSAKCTLLSPKSVCSLTRGLENTIPSIKQYLKYRLMQIAHFVGKLTIKERQHTHLPNSVSEGLWGLPTACSWPFTAASIAHM